MYSNLLLTPLKPKGWSLGERCSKTFAKPWPVKYPAMVWLGVGWERLTLTGVSNSSLTILGDPGAVSWAGLKGETKLFKRGQKSSWVPTLTGPFPNGQENAGSWLGTKNVLYYCAQSANSFSCVLFVSLYTTAVISPLLPGSFTKLS